MTTTESDSCVSEDRSRLVVMQRLCTECFMPIPTARLLAKPDASMCVKCLEESGDVSLVKRHDEYVGEELVSSFFTHDTYITNNLNRKIKFDSYFVESDEMDRLQTLNSKLLASVMSVEDELIESVLMTQ